MTKNLGFNESSKWTQSRFVKDWAQFCPSSQLQRLNPDLLGWDTIFSEVAKDIKDSKQPIGLIFDEVQWLAKAGSGFVGLLKAAWLQFERNRKTRIIVCGSSNKFFDQHVGGEEKILRGLKTRSDIWLPPLHLQEIKNHYGR